MLRISFLTLLPWVLSLTLSAQEPKDSPHGPEKKPAEEAKDKPADDKPKPAAPVSTEHSITINGQKIDYTATAGPLALKDAEGKTTAEIFYIAYTKKETDPTKATQRPLTFSFNGGPGSSSVWLHLGLLGPKRVKLQDNGFARPPPNQLGYSRAAKPEDNKNFHGLKEDARSIAEFIRLYITKNTRWPSPKFLIGESYGTTRAAALSGELLDVHRINLNGIMLVSTVLNFQTIWGGEGNDLPHALYLPSYAATAWYHKKLPADLQKKPVEEILKEAETFAAGDYNQALLLGSALAPAQRSKVIKQMARLTGLSEAFIDASNLRVSLSRFNAEFLRSERRVIGRFDSRYTSLTQDPLSPMAERDPSADAVFSAFTSTFNHYIRHDLKFEDDRPYNILGGVGKWNWDAENQFVNVTETLAEAMSSNPFLKIHVSNGIYDLATPYFAARHTFNHMRLHPDLQKNITQDDYTAGHMMYLNLPDLWKQKADLAKFIRAASAQ